MINRRGNTGVGAVLLAILLSACLVEGVGEEQQHISSYANQVVINEVAWMGNTTDYLQEWIELHNTTSQDIDLSGWVVRDLDGSPDITIPNGKTIPAGGYFVLARTSTAGEITPNDLTYSGNLQNSASGKCNKPGGVQLKLFDGVGDEVEHVDNKCSKNNRTWYAGDNNSKFTMERKDPLGPANDQANWADSTVVDGTPGQENSVFAGATPAQCQYPPTLEITPINIGQGDTTLIATPTKLVLADVGESYWNSNADAITIDSVITSKYGCKKLDHVVLSHFQVDHAGYPGYGGLWYLVEVLGYTVNETLIRDYLTNKGGTSGTYDNWVAYLAMPETQAKLNPRTPTPGEQIDLGDGIVMTIINVDTKTASCPGGWGSAPDLSCGGAYVTPSEVLGDHSADYPTPSENDYSVGFVISVGDFDMYIGGDTDGENLDNGFGSSMHDIESYAARDVGEVDILRVNHHGSDHSTNSTFVTTLQAQVAVLSVGNANTYGHARQTAIDRLLEVVGGVPTNNTWIYQTERGDDGLGGCLTDYAKSDKAAAELYGRSTIVSDTDGDYCTVEGGNVDIVVSADGSSFTVEGDAYVSSAGSQPPAVCGDSTCDPGETSCNCAADCGAPPTNEATCGDGVDNDCDGQSDCDDADCAGDSLCLPPACDNDGVCEAGEDCDNCGNDCDSKINGRPSSRYCCGNGVAESAEGNGNICDGNY